MFTGIIEGLGKITAISTSAIGGTLSIKSTFTLDNLLVGNSIAVNGICLTVNSIKDRLFIADISPETIRQTLLKQAKIGDLVNLERALSFSDRLNGHLVSGHIDGVSLIKHKKKFGNATILTFTLPKALSRYIITKGSIAVDGISLTINTCTKTIFDVSIIPHTLKETTLNKKETGDWVNIETDLVGKYIEQFVKKNSDSTKTLKTKQDNIDMTFLSKNGFA